MICMKETDSFKIEELLYYAFFVVMAGAKGLGFYEGQWPYTVALTLCLIMWVAKLLVTKYSVVEWVGIVFLCSLGILIYINSDEIGALLIIATLIGIKGVPMKRLMLIGSAVWIVTFNISLLLALLGVREDIFRAQDKLGLGYVIRWSLGQPHPNVLQISFLIICAFIMYVCRFRGKKLLIASGLMLLGNLYIFLYSISYTGFALAVLYIVINLYLNYDEKKSIHVPEKVLFFAVVPVCALFSVLGPNLFKGKLWDICNKLLNTRFYITKTYMGMNPISLFGSGYCNELPKDLNNLDSSYVYALMHYGIIFFILMVLAFIYLVWFCIRNDRKVELAIVLALCVAAISEPFFVNTSFKNIAWLFLGESIFEGLKRYSGEKTGRFAKGINIETQKVDSLLNGIWTSFLQKIKIILPIFLAVSLLAALVVGLCVKMPNAYYMDRDLVQVNGEHGFTFDINNLPADFDGEILHYTDKDTPMMRLDGNAVSLEKLRMVVSTFLWSGLASVLVASILFYLKDQREKNRYENTDS